MTYEELLQILMALGINPVGGAAAPPSSSVKLPAGIRGDDVNQAAEAMGIEPPILPENLPNVQMPDLATLVASSSTPSAQQQQPSAPAMPTDPNDLGYNITQGGGGDQPYDLMGGQYASFSGGTPSDSNFNAQAAGSAISSAMGKLAEGIAQQGQNATQSALKMMQDKQTDPRLQALMQDPLGPLMQAGPDTQAMQSLLGQAIPGIPQIAGTGAASNQYRQLFDKYGGAASGDMIDQGGLIRSPETRLYPDFWKILAQLMPQLT